MNEEKWAAVPGYVGHYWVSSHGRVAHERRVLKPRQMREGYLRVGLHLRGGRRKEYLVHRLVATAFCERPTGCDVVNHLNGTPTDNRAENLEWTTQGGNIRHAVRAGMGVGRPRKVTPDMLAEVIALRAKPFRERPRWRDIEKQFGVRAASLINHIKQNRAA